jgi:dCMP deaminase
MKDVIKLSTRISFDRYHIEIAKAAALRSSCNRAKVGAVIVNQNSILHTGYNGSLPGHEHCNDENCHTDKHCIRTTHAEINAVYRAFRAGWTVEDFESATIFCTHRPCYSCAKTLAAFGVKYVVYDKIYEDPKAEEYFEIARMIVYKVE